MTTAHRVLFIPELLDIVFSFLHRDSNVANACVCKRWSDIALDVVWREVDDLVRLFRLLKPICQQDDMGFEYCFEALPEASDWSRFEKYASRVRSLKFRPAKYDSEICSLLDDVARTRTSLEILPNMHTLEWLYATPALMERCKLFLHPRLRHLVVNAPDQLHPRPDFYTDLCARAPHLQSLVLFVNLPGEPIDAEIRILLQNLPELRKIVLPEFHYTSAVIEELSRADNIAVVDFSQDLRLGYGNPANVETFLPVLQQGAFPHLRELNLSARVDDLDRFFRSTFAPTRITTLYLNSYTDHSPAEVRAFLVTLSERCQLLSKLNIQLYHKRFPAATATADDLSANWQLSYETLKPIFALPRLTAFELVHKYPLRITLDEIEDLARRWPHLEYLMLNAEPLFLDEGACMLDLRALLPFVSHCPQLRVLGLYLDATVAEIACLPSLSSSAAGTPTAETPLESFQALRTLSVGTSLVRDANAVAMFLSQILPPRCRLEMGITWTEFGCEKDRLLDIDLRYLLQMRCVAWQAVDRLLPALIQLRQEERERSRALQTEVEDLRVRNRLLMDKANVKTRDSCVIA